MSTSGKSPTKAREWFIQPESNIPMWKNGTEHRLLECSEKPLWKNEIQVVDASALTEANAKLAIAVEALEFYATEVQKDSEEDFYAEWPLGWKARKALRQIRGEA